MRLIGFAAAAVLLSAPAALAAPAEVSVLVGPKLQEAFDKTYGAREAQTLTGDLRSSVERQLARSGAYENARIELLGDTPGLSLDSFGIGGAAIEGRIVSADGAETPIAYSWYETDIRQAHANWTWSDAFLTFDRFARRLAKGQELAKR
jgi:hypothetical protein